MVAREEARRKLDSFRIATDFDAFVSDRFPKAYKKFSSGMDQTARKTMLLDLEHPDVIIAAVEGYRTLSGSAPGVSNSFSTAGRLILTISVLIVAIIIGNYIAQNLRLVEKISNNKDECRDIHRYEHSCVRKDPASCTALINCFDRACHAGDYQSCVKLGNIYETIEGSLRSPERAFALYKHACDGGEPDGCFYVAKFHEDGTTVPQNYPEAYRLYEQLCLAEMNKACNNLAQMHEYGKGRSVNEQEALRLYQESCSRKYPLSCINVGILLFLGKTVLHDYSKAYSILNSYCQSKFGRACSHLGLMIQRKFVPSTEPAQAQEYYKMGCDLDDALGCYDAARLLDDHQQEPARVVAYYRKGCHLSRVDEPQSQYACIALGIIYEDGTHGEKKNLIQAQEYLQRACAMRLSMGCNNLGMLFKQNPQLDIDGSRQWEYFGRACELGNAQSCLELRSAKSSQP